MKLIIRFPNKKLTKEERDEVVDIFMKRDIICADKELELWKIEQEDVRRVENFGVKSVTKIFGEIKNE